jgi:hypothetical protein
MGLPPKGVSPGDKICILYGCSIPVLLRLKTKVKTPRKPTLDQSDRGKYTRRRARTQYRAISQSTYPHPAAGVPELSVTSEDKGQIKTVLSQESTNTVVDSSLLVESKSANQADVYTLIGAYLWHDGRRGFCTEGETLARLSDRM